MIEKKYFAPNMITAANMLLGFLSIVSSIRGNFNHAAYYILAAMVCDTLDGQTARKLNAFSEFGKEFDSFCDAISFGMAPAIFALSVIPTIEPTALSINSGAITTMTFIYALCGVMRLVKFNIITTASETKDDFSGMPIPCAASVIVSYYFLGNTNLIQKTLLKSTDFYSLEIFLLLTIFAGVLMVSTIPFKTPDKVFHFIPKKFFPIVLILIIFTYKYSLFLFTAYYILVNLYYFLLNKYTSNKN